MQLVFDRATVNTCAVMQLIVLLGNQRSFVQLYTVAVKTWQFFYHLIRAVNASTLCSLCMPIRDNIMSHVCSLLPVDTVTGLLKYV